MANINFDDQFVGLSNLINAAIGSRPYPLDGDFVKPNGEYIAIKTKWFDPDSWHKISLDVTTDDGYQQVSQTGQLRYCLEAVRGNSLMRLTSVALSLREPSMQTFLFDAGLAYQSHTKPIDSSATLDGVLTEDRAMMYIDFHAIITDTSMRGEEPSTIATVQPITNNLP